MNFILVLVRYVQDGRPRYLHTRILHYRRELVTVPCVHFDN